MTDFDRDRTADDWVRLFNQSCDSDTWGQVLEATEGYERLLASMRKIEASKSIGGAEKSQLSKIIVCLAQRLKAVNGGSDALGLSLDELKSLSDVISFVFVKPETPFPINITKFQGVQVDDKGKTQVREVMLQGGSLLPRPPPFRGAGTGLTMNIERIGLKNAMQYMDPFITVSVWDMKGVPLNGESAQDTPISLQKKEMAIVFGCDVHLQRPYTAYPPGAAIFFEFKHYKPKKKKISTKAYAFMEMDEIKAGPIALEIYKKPTDFKRKRVRLLSIKPLYLHLTLSLIND